MVVFTLVQRQGSKGAFKVLIASYTSLWSQLESQTEVLVVSRDFSCLLLQGGLSPLYIFRKGA